MPIRIKAFQSVTNLPVILIGLFLVFLVTWWLPALTLASQNFLFRLRGETPPPGDITILAIDDRSLQELGPWPWSRAVMAEVVNLVSAASPRVIGLDVLYAEVTNDEVGREADRKLAKAVEESGLVVMPAQLYDTGSIRQRTSIDWLRPAPLFASVSVALGHAHVAPGIDGMARTVQLTKASDRGDKVWAFALEIIKVADQIETDDIFELPGTVKFGPYHIPVIDQSRSPTIDGVSISRSNEMPINFVSSAGAFRTISIADLLDGSFNASLLGNHIVLIGATSQSLGDSRVVPFSHFGDGQLQGGQEMPGVEIHANIINTVRSRLNFHLMGETSSVFFALLVMALTLLIVANLDGWRQYFMLGLLLAAIIAGSYIAFAHLLILPPLVQMIAGFAVIIPFLINRSLVASRELDSRLAALAASDSDWLDETVPAHSRRLLDRYPYKGYFNFDWKLATVENLTIRLLARLGFINRILSSMGDGVIVADLGGRVLLSNSVAEGFFHSGGDNRSPANWLVGRQLLELLEFSGRLHNGDLQVLFERALRREPVQADYTLYSANPCHLSLLMTPIVTQINTEKQGSVALESAPPLGDVVGLVLIISDITRRVELDRFKSDTIQLVSHELRTPLNSINALSDVLLKFPVDPNESREMLQNINNESRRLSETVTLYLDLNRLESGLHTLNPQPINLVSLFSQVCQSLAPLADQKQIVFHELYSTDQLIAPVEPSLIINAVTNLLSNAIKYSPPQTTVRISAFSVNNPPGVCLSVRDQGYGIPPEVGERVFHKFYRYERDNCSETVGSGLGLALVKEIAELHGGTVTYQSPPGGGTEFSLVLPLTVQCRHGQP